VKNFLLGERREEDEIKEENSRQEMDTASSK
jgi:hypothetical protein